MSEDDIVLVHYLNIEKDKSGMRKNNDNQNDFERSRSRISNFGQTNSGNFGQGMMGLISVRPNFLPVQLSLARLFVAW
jgi:hypothetical protein